MKTLTLLCSAVVLITGGGKKSDDGAAKTQPSEGAAKPAPESIEIENLGDHVILHLDREQQDGGRVLAKLDRAPAAEGATVGFELPAAECHVFDAKGLALARRQG